MKESYRRMLEGMSRADPQPRDWGVYVLRCADGTLYTGVAKDVAARLRQHNAGKGAAYTRSRRPVELVNHQDRFTRSEALVCEAWIKTLPRARKETILAQPLDAREFQVYSVSKKWARGRHASKEADAESQGSQSEGSRG